jgi:membrane associated rhomboid family serine protease
MSNIGDQIKQQIKQGDGLMRLLIINVAVFLVYALSFTLSALFKADIRPFLVDILALPSDLGKLIFRPWTLVTYMFFHQDFFHLLVNMVMLYFSGMLFREFLGTRKLVSYYVLGGLAGGLLYVLFYNVFPLFEETVALSNNRGASAGVMAIIIAAASYRPQMPVRLLFAIEVKLWVVAVLFVLLDLVNLPVENPGGHIAHLGGALFGYLAIVQYKKGKDISEGFSQFLHNLQQLFQPKPKIRKVYSNKGTRKKEQSSSRQTKDKRMDDILDKISRSGYDSLTKAEKDFLFKIGKD